MTANASVVTARNGPRTRSAGQADDHRGRARPRACRPASARRKSQPWRRVEDARRGAAEAHQRELAEADLAGPAGEDQQRDGHDRVDEEQRHRLLLAGPGPDGHGRPAARSSTASSTRRPHRTSGQRGAARSGSGAPRRMARHDEMPVSVARRKASRWSEQRDEDHDDEQRVDDVRVATAPSCASSSNMPMPIAGDDGAREVLHAADHGGGEQPQQQRVAARRTRWRTTRTRASGTRSITAIADSTRGQGPHQRRTAAGWGCRGGWPGPRCRPRPGCRCRSPSSAGTTPSASSTTGTTTSTRT